MNRQLFFCKSWFRAKKRPTALWTAEQAQQAHDLQQPYTVLVDSAEHPSCFLDVVGDFIAVGFLDKLKREYLSYHFHQQPSGGMFMTMAVYREYAGDTDEVIVGTTYVFTLQGRVSIKKEVFATQEVAESESDFDPAGNHSPTPAFGEYDDLIRVERL